MTIQRAMALSARTAVRMAANATATPPPLKMMMMSSMSSVSSSSFGRRRQVHSTSASWKQGGGGEPVEAVEVVEAAAADTASAYQKEKAEAERRPGPDDGDDQQPSSSSSSSSSPPSPVPEWQNPRHHNDPQLQKVFFEDFDDKEKKGEEPQISPLPPFSDPDTTDNTDTNKVSVPRREVQDIADAIVGMNMLEVKELVDRIGEHFGLEDKPMTMFGGGGGGGGGGGNLAAGGGGAAEEEEEKEKKTSFDLKLTGYDKKAKIKVIKEVRACVAGLGLKEAKEMVEGAPKVIMKGIKMEQAEELKAKLEEIGATVEIV